jgi:hypothetical protein
MLKILNIIINILNKKKSGASSFYFENGPVTFWFFMPWAGVYHGGRCGDLKYSMQYKNP